MKDDYEKSLKGRAIIAGAAVGSAAIAAALLYASKRKEKQATTYVPPHTGEPPETD